MSINVTKFLVSNNLESIQLDLNITAGQTVTELLLWTDKTYKDPEEAIDISSLLAGTSETESITIHANGVGISVFSGIYFVQIKTSEPEAAVVATFNLTQYYVVLAKLISMIDLSCLNCNSNFQNALLFDLYLEATKNSLIIGRYRDAIANLEKLIITIDSSNCDACKDIQPVVSTAGNIVSVGVIDCLLTVI